MLVQKTESGNRPPSARCKRQEPIRPKRQLKMGHSPEKGATMPDYNEGSLLDAAHRNCSCFKTGHNLHPIAVLKRWTDEPRIPASIFEAPNGVFLVSSEMGIQSFYCHAPRRLASMIQRHGSSDWSLVAETSAITTPRQPNGSRTWAYLSNEPVNDCEKNPCDCYSSDDIWDED